MIGEVSQERQYGISGPVGWGFAMQGDCDDDIPPHRNLLEQFSAAHRHTNLVLPSYDADEDYVRGVITWDNAAVEVYYENLLDFMDFWSLSRPAIVSFRAAFLGLIR